MEVKTFEVRDDGTFIPVIAIRLMPENEKDMYLLSRAGYGNSAGEQGEYVIFGRLQAESEFQHDPFAWGNRTMKNAHEQIKLQFDILKSGSVIDVQYWLGDTKEPKKSESES